MTRTITPAEIKPGMTIRWTHNKVTYECPVMDRDGTDEDGGVLCHVSDMHSEYVDAEAGEVTVLAEPQPEEPTAFGARVVAGGYEFLLSHGGRRSWKARLDGKRYAWTDLCEMGSVAVIDATPSWTVPETPEVPERIEVWPEDDEALRAYRWRDCYKNVLDWNKTRWRKTTPSGYSFPVDAAFEIDVPCTRVADA